MKNCYMEKFIKYKRFEIEIFEIESFFDELVKNGWEIIYYDERITPSTNSISNVNVIIVCGKKQKTTLN